MTASVLVADDDPNILLSLEFLLKQAGYAVRVAADGEAVLSAVREAVPDLLLLDVMMPRRNGYDVCQTIRADHDLDGLRILMLTAKGRDVERDKGIALGADDYITKPFSTRDMLARVRDMLARPRL